MYVTFLLILCERSPAFIPPNGKTKASFFLCIVYNRDNRQKVLEDEKEAKRKEDDAREKHEQVSCGAQKMMVRCGSERLPPPLGRTRVPAQAAARASWKRPCVFGPRQWPWEAAEPGRKGAAPTYALSPGASCTAANGARVLPQGGDEDEDAWNLARSDRRPNPEVEEEERRKRAR